MRYIPTIHITPSGQRINAIADIQNCGQIVLLVKTAKDAFKVSGLWNSYGAEYQGEPDPLNLLDLDTPPTPSV